MTPSAGSAARRRSPAPAAGACALPLGQAPEVAAHLLRVDLAPGQVHVRAADQALLVGPDHHPLREHVVGVGQLRPVEALARGRGTRRSTRSAGCSSPAGRRRSACAGRSGSSRRPCPRPASALRPMHPDEAEVPVHLPLLGVDDRAQQRRARVARRGARCPGRSAAAAARRRRGARPRRAATAQSRPTPTYAPSASATSASDHERGPSTPGLGAGLSRPRRAGRR